MKKLILITLVLIATNSFSQSIEELKKQNRLLQEKIQVLSCSSNIIVKFVKCVGNSKKQTAIITFIVTNPSLLDQTFCLFGYILNKQFERIPTEAFDETGNVYVAMIGKEGAISSERVSNIALGSIFYGSVLCEKLSTGNLPLLCSVTFTKVLPSVKFFRLVEMGMRNIDFDYTEANINNDIGITQFNNVKITWR